MCQAVHIRVIKRCQPLLKDFSLCPACNLCHTAFLEFQPYRLFQKPDLTRREQRCVKHQRALDCLLHRAPAYLSAQHHGIALLCCKLSGVFYFSSLVISLQICSIRITHNDFVRSLHFLCQVLPKLNHYIVFHLAYSIYQHDRIHTAEAGIPCPICNRLLEARCVHHTIICKLNPYICHCHRIRNWQERLFKGFACCWIFNHNRVGSDGVCRTHYCVDHPHVGRSVCCNHNGFPRLYKHDIFHKFHRCFLHLIRLIRICHFDADWIFHFHHSFF